MKLISLVENHHRNIWDIIVVVAWLVSRILFRMFLAQICLVDSLTYERVFGLLALISEIPG